jgi:hypothetical protein
MATKKNEVSPQEEIMYYAFKGTGYDVMFYEGTLDEIVSEMEDGDDNVEDGDWIFVKQGDCFTNIVVKKTITLVK